VINTISTICFALAIAHTFLVPTFRRLGNRFRAGSPAENLFHLLGEVEVVFGIWAAVFFSVFAFSEGSAIAIQKLEATHFEEPVFVFVVMAMSSSKPVLDLASFLMARVSRLIPITPIPALVFSILALGPLLGSLITEPAAMTVSAFLILPILAAEKLSNRAKYLLLGTLFVNISIGGTLTHFAAPPVLVVARPWGWNTSTMFMNIGWRAMIAVFLSATLAVFLLRKELVAVGVESDIGLKRPDPLWNTLIHLVFIGLAVLAAHHVTLLIALFLFFLGWVAVTSEHQSELNLRDPLLVGFFLAGLMALGGFQAWWIKPIFTELPPGLLFGGATLLTAISDNALLTYLGTLVPELTDAQKYALVEGAVCGGGLTVIANAPNPIGFSVLRNAFGEDGISALYLLLGALIPTLIAALCFQLL